MSTTDDILQQIDDALLDWSIGPDAMRCGAPASDRHRLSSVPIVRFDRPPPLPTITPEQLAALGVRVAAAVEPFKTAMEKMARQMTALVASNAELRRAFGLPVIHDKHHPPKLCIDGRDYARRRATRKRRR